MLSYYYYFLGELLGEINYIIIIFPEYDTFSRITILFSLPTFLSCLFYYTRVDISLF